MQSKKFQFDNRDGQSLSARLDLPDAGQPIAYALFAHCFTCSKNLSAVGHISRALTPEGIAVLRFDFTGLGESEGDFADTNFSSNVEDLVDAAQYLGREYQSPEILLGHSFGGAAVLQAALQLPSVRAVATIGAPFEPQHAAHLFTHKLDEIEAEGEAEVVLAGRPFTIKKQFLDDIERQGAATGIRALDRPLLIFHGPLDNIVGIDQASKIFDAARQPKSFITLDQADHMLSRPADARYVGAVLAAWAGKYVGWAENVDGSKVATEDPGSEQEGMRPDALSTSIEPLEHGLVQVELEGRGFLSEVRAGRHRLLADEPESVGGTDMGPTPYDYLLAGLGACTAMTLRMYANHKKITLEKVRVRMKHSKIHAQDCEDCETEKGRIDLIQREVIIEGEMTEAEHARMLEIADRCPVHRTLESETIVRPWDAE